MNLRVVPQRHRVKCCCWCAHVVVDATTGSLQASVSDTLQLPIFANYGTCVVIFAIPMHYPG